MKRYDVFPRMGEKLDLYVEKRYCPDGAHCDAYEAIEEIENALQAANDTNRVLAKITDNCYVKPDSITKVVWTKRWKTPRLSMDIERDEKDFLYMVTFVTISSNGDTEVLEFRDDDCEIFKRARSVLHRQGQVSFTKETSN